MKPFIYIIIPTTKERREQTDRLLTSIRENTDIPHAVVLYENDDKGWVVALHRVLAGIEGYVMLLGCDTVVHEGWLSTLWKAFIKKFPKGEGVAEPYNELWNGKLCQHPMGHSSVIKQYLDRDFIHNWSDNWMTDRLNEKKLYLYVPEAKIEHRHWINGKAAMDKTYQTLMESSDRDRETYIRKTNELHDKTR